MTRVRAKGRKNPASARSGNVRGPHLVPRSGNPKAVPQSAEKTTLFPNLRVVSSDVRWGKVKTAQARMAVDYYDRQDVKEDLLDAVLKELERP